MWLARGVPGGSCRVRSNLPPWATVYDYFAVWTADGTVDRIHDRLRDAVRDEAGRDPMTSAGSVDSQSVKGADTVGAGSRGYDAGKKINGRKRHIVVDTLGLLLVMLVTAASVQDRDGGARVLDRARMAMPSLALVFADGGYAGDKLRDALAGRGDWTIGIIKRSDTAHGFELLPRRWVVERTFGWLGNFRRLSKDYEFRTDSSEAFIFLAASLLLIARLT